MSSEPIHPLRRDDFADGQQLGFRREARIRDYYQPGDDKVVFAKPLAA